MLGHKKEFFKKPPFRPVSSEAPQNTIWHVLKKCGTMFQKIIVINYIINYINCPTFPHRVKNGPLGRTLMNGDGLQDYKIIIYF